MKSVEKLNLVFNINLGFDYNFRINHSNRHNDVFNTRGKLTNTKIQQTGIQTSKNKKHTNTM